MSVHPNFTPSASRPEDLDAMTVGRESLFETLVHRISSAARDGSRPHTLLVAPRGAGKTHTQHVVVRRSLVDPSNTKAFLPVLIPEDSLAIGSYLDLLVEMARTIDTDLAETARGLRRDGDAVGIEQAIVAHADGRMVLLAVENLDRVFDALGGAGQGSLRAWVETSTAVMVFGTAPALFGGVSSRDMPWYGSFMVETLPEFGVPDGASILRRAAEKRGDDALASFVDSPSGRERLGVIHRLAGGLPRTWHILSDFVDATSLDALVPVVGALLDRMTPQYQNQLWELPSGEQRLVVELARHWEPRTVSDLAAAVGVSNQSAATALGRLVSARWVTSAKSRDGDRRASWYDLTEPLVRYQLRYREEHTDAVVREIIARLSDDGHANECAARS
ncbi:MarR family transcriptional regulator [Mycobacterium sp. NPDC006124]|uniref:MarR family transcriptional regulator n=1 Tax=Mycobacterium sp. NPDC006124 TaxID=3156729 RepID=UPI0033BE1F7F